METPSGGLEFHTEGAVDVALPGGVAEQRHAQVK